MCREYLRHLPICRVDPPGGKDIDDALHVGDLANSTLILGIHIADIDSKDCDSTALTCSCGICREDLRHLPICSVDPPGCKDIDDALHVRELANGNLELGVHIADVTNFLLPMTAMDDEAALRCALQWQLFHTVVVV